MACRNPARGSRAAAAVRRATGSKAVHLAIVDVADLEAVRRFAAGFSARVVEGSPAPLNIPIPPYYWKSNTVARIGEMNASGLDKDWTPVIW